MMKKYFSLLMLCLCGLAFSACDNESDDPVSLPKFEKCIFEAGYEVNAEVSNFFDFSVTYTAMDGTVKELKADNSGKFSIKDESNKLPAKVKMTVKAVKKANYEEYKASKEEFKLDVRGFSYTASSQSSDGKITILRAEPKDLHESSINSKDIDKYFELFDEELNFTFEATFSAYQDDCVFDLK